MLIEGENDSSEEIQKECEWILENLGDGVPVHFSHFSRIINLMAENLPILKH